MYEWPRLNSHRRRQVARLRRIDVCVLAACLGLAIVVYRFGTANQAPTVRELLPGMTASIERQGGSSSVVPVADLMDWSTCWGSQSAMRRSSFITGVIGAAAFYQVAHSIDVEEG
jgi:hypothetical protein